jgi:hypothetical protein
VEVLLCMEQRLACELDGVNDLAAAGLLCSDGSMEKLLAK